MQVLYLGRASRTKENLPNLVKNVGSPDFTSILRVDG